MQRNNAYGREDNLGGPSDGLEQPLISCILPTYNRRGYLPHAIHYFSRQDYPHKELLVVDDGTDAVGDLVPADPRIRYLRLPRIERTGSDVCGISDLLYFDLQRGSGHRYVYPSNQRPWLLGASLFFRRELWERNRFADIDVGMDGLFVWATPPQKVFALPEPRLAVHLIHGHNVSPKSPQGAWWSHHPHSRVRTARAGRWSAESAGSAPSGLSVGSLPDRPPR